MADFQVALILMLLVECKVDNQVCLCTCCLYYSNALVYIKLSPFYVLQGNIQGLVMYQLKLSLTL